MGPDRPAGFTLLELLIAITLLGLLMAGLLGGLRLGARAWETGTQRLDDNARLLAVHGFLADRLGHAMPVYVLDAGELREAVAFDGRADQLSMVTTLPDQLGPGLHTVTLALLDDDDDPARLVLGWRPFRLDQDGAPVEPDGGGSRVLLDGIEELELAYYGAPEAGSEPFWQTVWQSPDLLPTLIRLRIRFPEEDRRHFPELIVRPMIDYVAAF